VLSGFSLSWIFIFNERWQMAVVRHQGAASTSVSGDGPSSSLADHIHYRAWRVGVSVLVITRGCDESLVSAPAIISSFPLV
jgi:hypothetical protein